MTDTTKPVEPVAKIYATGDGTNGSWMNEPPPEKWGAQAVAYVPATALDAANAEIERLTKERVSLLQAAKDVGASLRLALARAEKAEAESAALVAAVYADAANAIHPAHFSSDYNHRQAQRDILERTPADATAALEAYGAAKVHEGMKAAADILVGEVGRVNERLDDLGYENWGEMHDTLIRIEVFYGKAVKAILAAIKEKQP